MMPSAWPRVAVSAVVVRDGCLLLVRRARSPHAGWLALPGGKVEAGETLDQALVRELREETGLEGRVGKLVTALDILERDDEGRLVAHFVLLVKRVDVVDGPATPGDDALSIHWLDASGLEAAKDEVTATTLAVAREVLGVATTSQGR